jgi:hypothetical protein
MAMNRMLEDQLEGSSPLPFFQRKIEKNKRPLLRDGRSLSDEELMTLATESSGNLI